MNKPVNNSNKLSGGSPKAFSIRWMPLLDIVEGLLFLRVVTIIITIGVVLSDSQSQSSSASTSVVTIRWLFEESNILGWMFLSSVCIYRLIVIKSFKNKSRWCWVDYTRDKNNGDEIRCGGFSVSDLRSILNTIRDSIFSSFYYQTTASERSDYEERTERSKEPTSFLSHYSTMSQIYPAFGSDKKRYDEDNLSKATKFQHVFYGDTLSKSQVDSSSSTIELSTFTSGTPPASRRGLLPPQKMSLDRGEDTLNTNNPNEGSYYNETTSSTLQNRKDL
mmetsp:Transcript_23769/g.56119  ORF Transcript_23769/g.56119 Transcript_23769/m.56119 type:complete len:277 (-) Transcript_23769:1231-2061(-)